MFGFKSTVRGRAIAKPIITHNDVLSAGMRRHHRRDGTREASAQGGLLHLAGRPHTGRARLLPSQLAPTRSAPHHALLSTTNHTQDTKFKRMLFVPPFRVFRVFRGSPFSVRMPSSQRSDGLQTRELAQRYVATAATRRCVRLASIASFDVGS